MAQYNFPELSVADIVQQFQLVFPDLGVDDHDFKMPKVDYKQNVNKRTIRSLSRQSEYPSHVRRSGCITKIQQHCH